VLRRTFVAPKTGKEIHEKRIKKAFTNFTTYPTL
jgi:hypothetical protein